MKKIRKLHIFAMLLLLTAWLPACRRGNTPAQAFTDTVYSPEYASGFTILGAPGSESLLIEVKNLWQGADSVPSGLFIARNGEKAPEGFTGQVIDGEAKRIVTMSSTNIAMLDAIDESERVVGVSGLGFITNPKILARKDEIGDVGYDGSVNYELILSLKPDIVLLYGVDGSSMMEGKLRELKIPYMYIGDYMESDPLGKAEWMVPISALAGKLEKGRERFAAIPERYNTLKDSVKEMTAQNRLTIPKVIANAPYSGSWFMPTPISYSGRLVGDAGGKLLWNEGQQGVAVPVEMEKAFSLASEADIWINPSTAASLEELKKLCPKYNNTDVLSGGNVWNNNLHSTPGGGNDYFESGVVHPDLILSDLIKIFHPELLKDEPFHYYKKLE